MELKLKQTSDKAKEVKIENGQLIFKTARFTPQADAAHKMMYIYGADYTVTIPEGYIGLLTASNEISVKSLVMPSQPVIFTPGQEHYIGAIMKANTDAIPAIFVEDEEVLVLTIVPYSNITTINVEEYVQEAEEVKEETTKEMAMADAAANESL